jgi:hypothetical protein
LLSFHWLKTSPTTKPNLITPKNQYTWISFYISQTPEQGTIHFTDKINNNKLRKTCVVLILLDETKKCKYGDSSTL